MSTGFEPRPAEPLVARNPFPERTVHAPRIEPYAEARLRLPVPLLPEHPHWVEMYWRAWEQAWSHLRRARPQLGLVTNFIDAGQGESALLWDTAFMVHFGTYGRRSFSFIGSLDNFYARQRSDGSICPAIHLATGQDAFAPYDPDGAGPGILAWSEWHYYRTSGDESRLAQVFWPLLAHHRWMRAHRTWPDGLYWATGQSSGMDNQERVPDGRHHHRHWSWVDASVQGALDCHVLWQMAELLGERDYVPELVQERGQLIHQINARLWQDETAFYHDVDADGRHGPVKSIGAYWALLDPELVPTDRLGPFLRHLREPASFRRLHRVPALAADADGYDPAGGRWRGGVWPATNYVLLRGLRAAGQPQLAHDLAVNHVENVCQVFRRTDTFWDHYAPDAVSPGEPALPDAVGCTGLTPITVLFEDVMGLHVDWPQRRVLWDRRLASDAAYGVRQYPLGHNGSLDLWGDRERITATTTTPFTLTVVADAARLQVAVPAGTTEIALA